MPKIGLFGGTFDPVHNGHLILGRQAIEQVGMDRMILLPAARSPFKDAPALAPPAVRLEMLRAAVEGEPRMEVDPLELGRPEPSYTIDTVLAFHGRHPGAELFLVIGEDNLTALPGWRRFDELRARARFVVFSRGDGAASHPLAHASVRRRLDISATEIRARVAAGLSIRYLVPEPVLRIIQRDGLYRTEDPHHRN